MTITADPTKYHGVKEADDADLKRGTGGGGGGLIQFLIPAPIPGGRALPPVLPMGYGWGTCQQADYILAATPRFEAMWSAAVYIATTKIAAMDWDVDSEVALRSKRAQDLLVNADRGKGWVQFVYKQVRSYLCRRNGSFIEIERASSAKGSKILGLHHLPSSRCRRTGDPDRPVVYLDTLGREHVMRWWEVMEQVDMPEDDESTFGAGLPAAERAYPKIILMAALEAYVMDKVSGRRPLAIHLVSGMTTEQIGGVITSGEYDAEQRAARQNKFVSYMGAVIGGTMAMEQAPALVTIPLAELPDGFNAKEEREEATTVYADCIGLDPQELRALSNGSLGNGGQSHVLNDKAKGKGLAAYVKGLEYNMSWKVLDQQTTFTFTSTDVNDKLKEAELRKANADTAAVLAGAQPLLTQAQTRQWLVDNDVIGKEYLPVDQTDAQALSDNEKPLDTTAATVLGQLVDLTTVPAPVQPKQLPMTTKEADFPFDAMARVVAFMQANDQAMATKATRLTVADLDEAAALTEATKLYKEVTGARAERGG